MPTAQQQRQQQELLQATSATRWPPVAVVRNAPIFPIYRVAKPSQYLVKTGIGSNKAPLVCKKTLQLPLQMVSIVEMNPRNYKFLLDNMSEEMVPFRLPVVFTIGPKEPFPTDIEVEKLVPHTTAEIDKEGHRMRIRKEAHDSFLVYCQTMLSMTGSQLTEIIEGVIQGETRIYSAGLSIREMFSDRESFRKVVVDKIQRDLDKYGLYIYNANIAEMHDLDMENKYFYNLKQKALEGASAQARVEVADARKAGDVGEAQRRGDAAVELANIQAVVQQKENLRTQEIVNSQTDLEVAKAAFRQKQEIARIEADNVTRQREVNLETELQKRIAQQKVEQLRASEVSAASVKAEAQIKQATGEAEAKRLAADADLYRRTKEAEGIRALAQAQAAGLAAVLEASNNDAELAKFFIAVERQLFVEMGGKMAEALQGLSPKLNIWTTGTDAGKDAMSPLQNLFKNMPPMLDALQQQTNVQLPTWMPQSGPAAAHTENV